MTRTLRIILVLTSVGGAAPASASDKAAHPPAGNDHYVAKLMGTAVTAPIPSNRGMSACAADDNPSDPILFKRADGRCSGQ
jgi:hypothetical protein